MIGAHCICDLPQCERGCIKQITNQETRKMTATVKYQVATYHGTVNVPCSDDDDNEIIIAKAKRIVTRNAGGSLPFGSESWKIIERQ